MVTYCFEYVDGRVPSGMKMNEVFGDEDSDSYFYRTEHGFNVVVSSDGDLHEAFQLNLRDMVDNFGFESIKGVKLLGVYRRGSMGDNEYHKGRLIRASEPVRQTIKQVFRQI